MPHECNVIAFNSGSETKIKLTSNSKGKWREKNKYNNKSNFGCLCNGLFWFCICRRLRY